MEHPVVFHSMFHFIADRHANKLESLCQICELLFHGDKLITMAQIFYKFHYVYTYTVAAALLSAVSILLFS